MDEETKDYILHLQAQISALGAMLFAKGIGNEEIYKKLSEMALEKLKQELE